MDPTPLNPLALLLQLDLINMLSRSTPLGYGVLVVLICLSLISWAIIFAKWSTFRHAAATTASVAPFIGLFGTVIGIIRAFNELGTAGSASLRAVGPGISDALLATAVGLFAAIPAAVAYNYFGNMLKEIGARMDDFLIEFLNMTERNFEE